MSEDKEKNKFSRSIEEIDRELKEILGDLEDIEEDFDLDFESKDIDLSFKTEVDNTRTSISDIQENASELKKLICDTKTSDKLGIEKESIKNLNSDFLRMQKSSDDMKKLLKNVPVKQIIPKTEFDEINEEETESNIFINKFGTDLLDIANEGEKTEKDQRLSEMKTNKFDLSENVIIKEIEGKNQHILDDDIKSGVVKHGKENTTDVSVENNQSLSDVKTNKFDLSENVIIKEMERKNQQILDGDIKSGVVKHEKENTTDVSVQNIPNASLENDQNLPDRQFNKFDPFENVVSNKIERNNYAELGNLDKIITVNEKVISDDFSLNKDTEGNIVKQIKKGSKNIEIIYDNNKFKDKTDKFQKSTDLSDKLISETSNTIVDKIILDTTDKPLTETKPVITENRKENKKSQKSIKKKYASKPRRKKKKNVTFNTKMKIAVTRFPGTNNEHESVRALKSFGVSAEIIDSNDIDKISDIDGIWIAGGFSYGDVLRAGAIASISPLMKEIHNNTKPILGICNGFQILTEADLLPGSLIPNSSTKFICDWIHIKMSENDTYLSELQGATLRLPIAHFEGNLYANSLEDVKPYQIAQYSNFKGLVRDNFNPNGSIGNIAGLGKKNIAAMMPHPERASFKYQGSTDGRRIIEAFLQEVKK